MSVKIYLDVLVITNICLTAVFILCTARLTHNRPKKKRMAAGALIGGLSSMLAILYAESFFEGVLLSLIKLGTIFLCVFIVFETKSIDKLIKYSVIYISANLFFAGLCVLLWRTGKGRIIYINTLTIYLDISLGKLMAASTVTYLALSLYEYIQRKSFSPVKRYHILLKIEHLEYFLPAVADTGNSLTDVFTGKPVVIVVSDELYYHFELDREEIACKMGFHCIPYSTINGEGLINVTDRASVTVIDNDKRMKDIDCAVGIVSCGGNRTRAIFSPSLII
ncbi:sigma-E processing peptidase SpoIIGA [Ruminococcus sp. NK3A76]|uniref:sigma-E processing peptidase SpoIIGA n=1 Tax=Ruminococcus sp. NK3A76 TaxID=877411 RepID=UPI0018DD5D6D|nr:sigma-E processing peptidase SpoIIGA [Ruminococcus sp. NK3A76]